MMHAKCVECYLAHEHSHKIIVDWKDTSQFAVWWSGALGKQASLHGEAEFKELFHVITEVEEPKGWTNWLKSHKNKKSMLFKFNPISYRISSDLKESKGFLLQKYSAGFSLLCCSSLNWLDNEGNVLYSKSANLNVNLMQIHLQRNI